MRMTRSLLAREIVALFQRGGPIEGIALTHTIAHPIAYYWQEKVRRYPDNRQDDDRPHVVDECARIHSSYILQRVSSERTRSRRRTGSESMAE
jgi:hypothetical protein